MMTLKKLARKTALATLVVALSASSALSVEAVSTLSLNVRSGPGTGWGIVDSLYKGETVDVVECNPAGSWCRIFHEGPDGWVASKYLAAPGSGGSSGGSSSGNDAAKALALAAIIGIGAVIVGTAINNPPGVTPKVCFYNLSNFNGASKCVNAGTNDNKVTGYWNNRVSSLRVFGGASVRLCKNWFYGGTCKVYHNNKANLPGSINNKASSFQTW